MELFSKEHEKPRKLGDGASVFKNPNGKKTLCILTKICYNKFRFDTFSLQIKIVYIIEIFQE